MRRIILPLFTGALLTIAGCSKEGSCPPVTTTAPADEVAELKAYLTGQGITAQEDARGFFYTISEAGNSDKPDACTNVTVKYKGTLLNGAVFDESTAATNIFPYQCYRRVARRHSPCRRGRKNYFIYTVVPGLRIQSSQQSYSSQCNAYF